MGRVKEMMIELQQSTDDGINQIQNTIIYESVKAKWIGCCLLSSVLLHEALDKIDIPNKLVNGFKCVKLGTDAFSVTHVWVEIDDEQLDVSTRSLGIRCSEITKTDTILSTSPIPEEYPRVPKDYGNKTEKLYNVYLRSPKKFWKDFRTDATKETIAVVDRINLGLKHDIDEILRDRSTLCGEV